MTINSWVDYLCLSSFTDLFVKFFVCTRLTALSWLFVFIVIYRSFVKFFVFTRLTVLSWLFVFIVIYRPFCQVFRMYQTHCVELAICVYRHLPIFLSSFSYVPDLLRWVDYLCLSLFTNLFVKFFVCTRLTVLSWLFVFIVIYRSFCQGFRMYQTYCVELAICVYRLLPIFLSIFSYVPDLLRWVDYLSLSSFTDLFVKFFVCTRLTALSWLFVFIVIYRSFVKFFVCTRLTVLSWLFVFIVIYRPFCQVFRMYQTYWVELAICVYRHLPIFLSSFSYVPDLLCWIGYLCLSSFTDLFVKFFVCTRLTGLSWLFVFIVIYRSFCQVFRIYQTYWVELTICVYRHLPTFLSSFSYVPDLLGWVGYLCLSSFTNLFVKFFVCTRLTALSWLFVFIVIYRPFCQVFRMYQTYWVEVAICVYRHLPIFLSSFSYVPDLLCWVGYLCLSSFTDLFVKFFVCTRLTGLSWLFVFIVIYRPFCQVFRMYQTYCVELAICVYRHLPTFLSSFSYVPDLLGWIGYLCLSSFTDLFVKFFVCTRLTGLSWLSVFIVIYQPFCQVFRMYQTYCVELAICVYRHLPIFLSSFSYVPDLLRWVGYLCLSSFTNIFVKFFVCTRLTALSWLFVFIVIYRSFCQIFRMYQTYCVELAICVYRHLPIFCQVFRMYQTYCVELTICVYRHLPTFLSSFSYVPDLLGWVDYLCLSSFTNLFVKFFVCTRLTALSWLFVFIFIYQPFCQVFRMYQTYCVELAICAYRHLPTFLSSFSYVPDLLRWVDYLCLSLFTDLFVKFFVCTRLTGLSWLFVFIVIYRPFCQVFRMYQTYCVELAICVYRHLPIFLSSFSYVPDLLGWVDYLCLSSFTNLFIKFFVCTRLTGLSWLFVFIVIYRSFCQVFRMYQTYCVELTICVYRHLPTFLSSFSYVPDLLCWVGYLCLSSFTDLFVKFFVCTRLTGLRWLFVFIVFYRSFCQFFRMYQTYCVELAICAYRHLPTFLSSFSYVPDLLRWVDYLCLSLFTDLFVKFFVCTRLTGLSWLFVFIVIYRPFCQVFRMYQTYCVELAICVYRHLPIFLSSFSYVPDLLGWVDYLCLSSFTNLFIKFFVCTRLTGLSWLFVFIVIYRSFCQVFRMYQTYCVELTICVYRHLPTFLSSFSYVPDLLCWVGYLCLSSFTDLFVKFFVCTRLTGLRWLFVFIVFYRSFCQFFRMYQTYCVELTIWVYRHLPIFLSSFSYVPDLLRWVGYLCLSSFTDLLSSFSYVPDLLCWVDYLCLSSFTDLFVKFFVCTRLTGLSWLFVFIVIYRSFCQVFRMYQTYCVELAICVYRHLPIFLSSFSYVPDLLGWVDYLCLSSFTDLFVKFFVCTRLTGLSWLFVFIVIYQPFCQVFRMYQTYWVELAICVYRHLPTFLSSFSYVPDLLLWVGYLCLSSFTDLFVKFFVCTRLTGLRWLFVFIVIYRSFVKFFVCTRLTVLSWLFVFIVIYPPFCQVFRMYQTYWVELAICVYRHLPIFLSSFSYVPDLLCWIGYLCLSSFTDLFVKFFVCTRLTGLSWLFVFIVIYRPFCQVFRMYQTYWVELTICVYRHLPTFLSSFSYVPDLLGWVGYLCLSSFTNLFVKFFVCTRLTALSWLFVFIVIYRAFCQVFRMYQTYWVEVAICVYRHLPIFLSSFSYVPDLLCWVDYLCLSSFTDLFVKFFVCTRLTGLSWLFVFIVIYRSFCQVFRMYQTYWVEVAICVYRHLLIFLSSFSYVPDLLRWVDYLCLSSFTDLLSSFSYVPDLLRWVGYLCLSSFTDLLSSFSYVPDLLCWVDYLCLSSFTDLFVKFFVCTRLTGLSWLFVFIVIYRSFCQVFRMYQTYCVELTICVYRHLPTFLSSFSYVPDLLCWVGYLCLSSFTDLFVKFFVCTRLTGLRWLFVFIVFYRSFCQFFRMYQTYCVELTIWVYRHLPIFLSSFSYVPDLLRWVGYLCLSSFTDLLSSFSYVPDLLCWVDYLCLSSFTDLFVKFFVCTRLTGLSWLFVFIVIYRSFCQVFRMYQTYCVELAICVYRHLPIFLSSFSYVPDLLGWVDYLCLSSFTDLFVKFFVCTRLTGLSWLFVFIVIYQPFCQVFRMYQTYWVELAICVYRHLPTFLSSFSYVPDLLLWVGYLCLSSFTDLFVKFFVCTRLTGLRWLFVFIVIYRSFVKFFVCTRLTVLSWLFVFIVIYPPFCQVFRMYQTYWVELTICVYRHLPIFLSSFSYVPDLLCWIGYLCLSSFTDLFVKFFVCTRLTGLSWLFVFIVIYRPFCQVFRMYQTYWVELTICVYRHLPTFLSSFSYVPDLLGWVGYLCLSSFTNLFVKFFVCTRLTALSWLFVFIVIYRAFCQVFRMYQTYWVEVAICVYRHLPIFLSSFSYVPDLLCWVDYLCLSSFTDLFVKFFVCTRLTGLSWLFVFIVIYRSFCQVFRMYQTYWVEVAICVYRHLPIFLSSFSYVPDLLRWVDYLCLSSFTDLFVKFFVCTRLTALSWLFVLIVIYRSFVKFFVCTRFTVLSWLFVFIVIYRPFCQVFRMYQTYWVELAICVYRHLPIFLSSFSYVPDLLGWIGYLCLSSFTDLFVKFFVCTRLTGLSWLFVFIVIYRPFCQVFRMYQTYCVELAICVYRHLPTFLSSFSYVPDLLRWVGYLCLSSFTNLFVKFFVCTRLTVLSWLFVFIVIYRSFCQIFRMYQTYCVELAICVYRHLPIFCQVFRIYQTYCVELTICVYRHLPTFLSSFSYVPDSLRWVGYLCLSSFTDLFVKFFVCTRLTALSWLFVFIVIYQPFCQVFRMYQTYCVELTICVYRHLPTFLSSFSYVPDLLCWVGYLCLSSFTDLFVKFFVCTRLTVLSWLFVLIVIYQPFCQVFRMYQTYCVELTICVYRHLPIFLSNFSYVPDLLRWVGYLCLSSFTDLLSSFSYLPDLLCWVDYLCLSSFTDLFVKFFVCTRLTALSWLFVFIVIYRSFCQVFRMYQTYCVELTICVYRYLPTFLSSFSYVPDLLCWVDYLCLSSFTDLFVKFFVCTRLTVLSWLFVFIVIYRSFCQVFRMYHTYWVELTICVYRHLPTFLSSVSYVPDLLCWVGYLCLSSFTNLFVKFFVCTRLTALSWLFGFIVIYQPFCQVFRMYQTYCVEFTICVYRHLPTFLSSFSYVPDLLCWIGYLCLSSFTDLFVKFFVCTRLTGLSWLFVFIVIYRPFCQVFRMYQTYWVELTICVYRHLPTFLSSFSYVPDLLGWVGYLCLSSFTNLFVKFFVCTRLTALSWLFVFIVIYRAFCQVFRMYQTYWVEVAICVYRHLPIFLSSFSYVPDLLCWVDYLCLSSFTDLFVKFFVCTRLTGLSWLFVFIVIYRSFCQVFRMYQTYWVEVAICVYRHLLIFLSSFSYVPDLLRWVDYLCLSSFTDLLSSFSYVPDLLRWVGYLCLSSFTDLLSSFSYVPDLLCWVDYLCLSSFTDLFVKFFVCTRLTGLSWLFVFIVIYRSFCQVFRMYQTYCVELTICVYRHLPTFLSSFSYVPDLLCWVGYLCLSSFTDLFVKFFVCTRLTGLRWLFVFIVFYRSFCQFFRMYQTYCVELTIWVYRHLPIFLSSFSYVPDLLRWVGYLCLSSFTDLLSSFSYVPDLLCWVDYLCLSSFTDLFVKFFVCTRLTGLSWLFVFIVIYRSFCQVFRMYQTYCVELAICVYRHLPIFLSSFSYVPDLLGWVDYLCLSSFTDLFVKFFVCTRLTGLSWLFVFIVIYQPFCQVFRMYQTYWVELAICVYRHLPTFLSSFSYVPDLLLWVGYLCLSSFTDLFVKFFVCTRLTGLRWLFVFIVIYRSFVKFFVCTRLTVLSWLFVFIVIYPPFCQVFRMYQTYWVELTICVYRHLPIFLSSFSYVPDLLCWIGYLCLSSFTDLFVKFFVCTRLTGLSWLFVFIVIYRPFCQVFRMYQTYWVELTICVYRHLPTFLSSFSYVPDLLGWVGYLCLSSFTNLFVKFFVCTRLTALSWLFVFIVIYRAFCQVFRMYQTYWVEVAICVYRHLPIFLSSFSYVPDLLCWVDYLCLSSFTDLFVKFFVCTRLTGLRWLFVFIVIYRSFCQVFRMYQTYCVELTICVYRHLPIFLSSFSYVPDLLRWVGYLCLSSFTDLLSSFSYVPDLLCWVDYLCLSSFTDLFVKFFVCTRLTGLSWLFVFIVIYRSFCQVFRMYQTYWVELAICVYRHLPIFLSSFSYVPDLLGWVDYLCLSSFTDLFVKFFVCTRLTALSWLFVFIVIYRPFCQVFRMYQTYCVELAICAYRHLPTFLSSFSYVPDLLCWVDYLCLSSFTDLFVKFFVCTRLTALSWLFVFIVIYRSFVKFFVFTRLTVLSWLFVFIVIYRPFCQVFRMYQTHCVELAICVYRHLPIFLSSFSYVPDLLRWVDYLCLSLFTNLFVKFFVCTRLTVLSWLFVFIVIYRPFCQVFRMYQTYCVELAICVYRHLPIFLSSFSYVPDLLCWVGYLCLSSFTNLFVKFFVCTRLTALSWLFVFIVIYRSFCQIFRMYQTYCVELAICVYRHLPIFCQVFRIYQTYCVELTICVYRHLPTFLSSFSYVPDSLRWVGYLCLSSFTDLFVKFFVCTRLTALSWLFVFIVIYQPFCQVFRMYQTYCVELTICVYRHLPTFLSSFSYVPDLLCWVGYLCLSSFTDLFVKFFVCTTLTGLSWLFVFIVIYQPFCLVFRMYQTYCVELAICVYRHLPTFLSSFSYVPDLLRWVDYLGLSLFTNLFVKFFVCTRLTVLSLLFVFIVIYRPFCQVFRMHQTYCVELAICVYRHLPIFLSSFSYVPDLLGWVDYLCLSSFTDLFVKCFVCTRLTVLSWLFVFIVIYQPFCQVFRMYQTYWVELAICVYRHLPIFLSSFSYVPDLLGWVDYLCLSSFTNLFVKFFVCTRLTALSWLFVFIVIYRSFCQVFRMYQTYCVELAICAYRHLPTFLSSFSYVPDLLRWVDYLCLSSFTDHFVKFFVCTRLTALSWLFVFIVIYRSFVKFFVCTRLIVLSWLFVFIVIYRPFCQVFRMYQTYWVELTICVYRHLPTFLSSFSYVPDLLRWVGYLCLSSFTNLFVKFFVCTRLTALSWLFVLIVIYQPFCQVFRMYQTYCVELTICVYRYLPIFLSSFSYVPDLLGWVDYLCLTSFTDLFVKFFVCTRLTALSWLFVFIVIYRSFCQVFRMYQTYWVELTICVYRHLPTFLSSFSYVPDLLGWVGYLCLSSFTDLFVKFFVCTRLTVLSWLFVFIVIYRPFCQVFRMYQTYCVELAICVYRHLPNFLSSFSYVPDLLGWGGYLCLSSFTDLFVNFFVCTRLTALSWLFVFIVIYRSFCQVFRMYQTYCVELAICVYRHLPIFCQVFRMYQTYCVELTICVYRHLPTFLSSFSYLPDLLRWVGYLCLSSFTNLFVKFFVCTRLTALSWLFVLIVIYQPFCQVFRMYQTYCVELTICVYRYLPTFLSSFWYVSDLLCWVDYLCLSSFTDLFVKFFVCTRLTALSWLFVFIVIYRSFCQVFRMYQTYWVELTICVYRHLPTFLSSFSYVPDLLGWVGYLCLSSFTDLFVKFFVCTRLTVLSWLFVFIVIYRPFCQVFRMYQTYCVELAICVYRHLPIFLSSFSYVPDLLGWGGYLCLSSFTDLFVNFFVCTRLTALSWLFVFIVIYRSFCQVFRMYQTYCVELAICVYRHLPIFLSSFSYVPDLLGWVDYLCLSSFTDLFVKFFVCTRLTGLSWLFVFIVIYQPFCQVFRMYQTYWVELAICVYRHLPTFLSSFSYVPDLLLWVGYLCLSSFTDLFVKFFVCTRLTGLRWLFVFIVIYRSFCQVFRMYQTYCVELTICVYRHLPTFLSSFSYVPDLLGWVGYLCLSSSTDLFVKFFVCTRLTGLRWLFVFIVIYRSFCQVFRMYQTYCVELTICVYRHLPIFLSSFSYVPDLLRWVGYLCLSSFTDLLSSFSYVPDLLCWVDYLCLSSFTDLFVKFFVCTRLTGLSWLFVFIVIYRSFCQVFRMYQTYWVELAIINTNSQLNTVSLVHTKNLTKRLAK